MLSVCQCDPQALRLRTQLLYIHHSHDITYKKIKKSGREREGERERGRERGREGGRG